MKAIVQSTYGPPDVLEFTDVETPEPKDGEVLVRVHATSVGPWVWRLIGPDPLVMRIAGVGLLKPKQKIPGADLAGVVEAVGRDATRFVTGDVVYGETSGTFAEYATAREADLAPMPGNLTFEQAAAVPVAANTALLGLRDHGRVEAGQKVLIIGAAGGVGTFAVQIGKSLGAEVTAVCSTDSVDLVRRLGADQVIDYTREDFATRASRYDVVFQLAGTRSAGELRRVLEPNGILVLSSGEGGRWIGPIGRIVRAVITSPFVSRTHRAYYARPSGENLLVLTDLIESGEVEPVIDRTYPLSDAAEAIRALQAGHARGKTVITI